MSEALLTPKEAAAFLKMSLAGFYAWRRRHNVRTAIAGRALRFRVSDLLTITQPPESSAESLERFREMARQHGRTGPRRREEP